MRLCRRINIIRMPRRARTATPPNTAPAMRPGDGDGDEDLLAVAVEVLDVGCDTDCDASELVVIMVD